MKKKPVSIKTIAEALNVSVTTVSFVLNGKAEEKHISKTLTKKVLDYVAEINYRPNQIAQSLRTGESKILVFMVEDISNSFFANLARIIEDAAYERGYKIIFCSTENDDQRAQDLINIFRFRQVDGFILVPPPGIQSVVRELVESHVPVVLLDRYYPELETNIVVIDNRDASAKATRHLIGNGFRRIGFITTDALQTQMLERRRGYEETLAKEKLPVEICTIPFRQAGQPFGKQLIEGFVKSRQLDAVFFATNYLAQSGLEVFTEKQPEMLEHLGLVTFDDADLFRIVKPSITAVRQPLEQMGRELMSLMLSLVQKKGNAESARRIVLNAELIVRESSRSRVAAHDTIGTVTPLPPVG